MTYPIGYSAKPRRKREFHISIHIRRQYHLDSALFSLSGNVLFTDHQGVRNFVSQLNKNRPLVEQWKASEVAAMALIDEINHYIFTLYAEKKGFVWTDLIKKIKKETPFTVFQDVILSFMEEFPPTAVYNESVSATEYLEHKELDESGLEVEFEELILLALANENKAFSPFSILFNDEKLKQNSQYSFIMTVVEKHMGDYSPFGPDNSDILTMLRSPAKACPTSLEDQLHYIYDHWGYLLNKQLLKRLLKNFDFLREENKHGVHSDGSDAVMDPFSYINAGSSFEPEAFSPDQEWMPNVNMLAKNTLVWLDQLSKKYQQDIKSLDAVPEEELRLMAERGFNALWLIGLWQRSDASRRIKQIMGNPEAEASAYSLHDNQIAERIGGWAALEELRQKANRYGIRLASDMVPNHTGMDSRWIIEKPQLFMQLPYNPFPQYSFNGENLSHHHDVGIYLEDHYYSRSDASVVFKRVDFNSGEARYIYHGNDGTATPWNDTAQINFLNPEAREAVIQEILHVARNFPIIRFDAAMVLAKKHIQRLWYPTPGTGGDIATRSDFAMSDEDFNKAIPIEFWREVVDRVAEEVPNTLLLAEAFWMLEGYFVRSLGMHRVYNSAFMNMLMKEENGKYRETIRNTQEFDSEILKRFVNFMSNPDEKTAEAQFGRGDKYFGVCAMMCTMPGLPMFAHGQIEGYAEKYGMEYSRAYYNEDDDSNLIARHNHEIFPLLRKRPLFSGCQAFRLYDFISETGDVNDNVFAYSNRHQQERMLFVYNNSSYSSYGRIKESSSYSVKTKEGRVLQKETLAAGMGLHNDPKYFLIMKDHKTDLFYLHNSRQVVADGLQFVLSAYQYQLFWHISEDYDYDGELASLCWELGGSGIKDLEVTLAERRLHALYQHGSFFFDPYNNIARKAYALTIGQLDDDDSFLKKIEKSVEQVYAFLGTTITKEMITSFFTDRYTAFMNFPYQLSASSYDLLTSRYEHLPFLSSWIISGGLNFCRSQVAGSHPHPVFDQWLFSRRLMFIWAAAGWGDYLYYDQFLRAFHDFKHPLLSYLNEEPQKILISLFQNSTLAATCGFNWFNKVLWFDGTKMELAMDLLTLIMLYENSLLIDEKEKSLNSKHLDAFYHYYIEQKDQSNFKVEHFLGSPAQK